MFWTIVGALLFVFVGIPIIITILGGLGIGSVSVLANWFDRRSQKKDEVISMTTEQQKELNRKLRRNRWLVAGGGFILLVVIIVALSSEEQSNYVGNYNNNISTISSYQEQLNKNAAIEKQRYTDYSAIVSQKYPDKSLSAQDQIYIINNLPFGVNFATLKPMLIAQGFEFVGYEQSSATQSNVYSEEINGIVKQLKIDYPDMQISYSEEFSIRNNIPSYIQFNTVKDEMLKQGFKFQ